MMIVLVVWMVYILVSLVAVNNVVVDFKTTYFIPKASDINKYLEAQDVYY